MPKPIRLLQIASTSEIGGAEQLMLNVVRYADPARLKPEILTLMGDGPLAAMANEAGGKGTSWNVRNIADPRLFFRMRKFLRENEFDVIQTYGLRADLLARPHVRALHLKLISSIVSIDPWRKWHHRMLDRLTRGSVAAWMSTSQAATRAKIENEGVSAEKITTIPTGIPDRPPAGDFERAQARARFGVSLDQGPVLAIVANIRPAKGYPDLIEALAILKPKWPRAVCLCAGRDDSNGEIPLLADAKGVGGNIKFLGYVADAPAVYDAAELAILTSHWEGMPHALIEAIRAGLAVVATEVGGNGEVVRHEQEGLLCPPKNPKELAAAIDRALSNDDQRKEWGASARRRFESEFRVELMVGKMTELYESVFKSRKK